MVQLECVQCVMWQWCVQSKTRHCLSNSGDGCAGPAHETKECLPPPCPGTKTAIDFSTSSFFNSPLQSVDERIVFSKREKRESLYVKCTEYILLSNWSKRTKYSNVTFPLKREYLWEGGSFPSPSPFSFISHTRRNIIAFVILYFSQRTFRGVEWMVILFSHLWQRSRAQNARMQEA